MSRDTGDVNKLTETTYKNVMEQFNPGLRTLVVLGKNYEKSVTAMTLAGKIYFDAVSKIGETAAVSPASRELGVALTDISEAHKKILLELEENLKRFQREMLAELEKKTEMDVKYMNATFKRYQSEHKVKQDSLARSQSDLKKMRRKTQGKNASKYLIKENECLETFTTRQSDMQSFIADGCREALLEEKRRFCFLVDKHCMFSYQTAAFHEKAKDMLTRRLPHWQEKCTDVAKVPDAVITMIEGLRAPASPSSPTSPSSPASPTSPTSPSAVVERLNGNNLESGVPPPAPQLKAQISPLASMFIQDVPLIRSSSSDQNSDQGSLDDSSLSRSASMSSGLNVNKKLRVRTIFPHTAGNNDTLLSFDEGDLIALLIQEEKDGWLYGELERTKQRGWFPSSYCRPHNETAFSRRTSSLGTPGQSLIELEEEEEGLVLLPPPDYTDDTPTSTLRTSTPSPEEDMICLPNGIGKPPFLGTGNPFATVKLRPTITNDRSAPLV